MNKIKYQKLIDDNKNMLVFNFKQTECHLGCFHKFSVKTGLLKRKWNPFILDQPPNAISTGCFFGQSKMILLLQYQYLDGKFTYSTDMVYKNSHTISSMNDFRMMSKDPIQWQLLLFYFYYILPISVWLKIIISCGFLN